jgi:hypothetical protein
LVSTRNTNLEFYLARAAQARAEADAATLDHVRERCQRSEAAWTELADRAQRSERMKADEALRKAEQVADK